MSQLSALVWLKWTLTRNSLRSRRAAAGRVASLIGALAGLTLSLLVAAGLGLGSYFITSAAHARGADSEGARAGFVVLLFLFTVAFMMWALMPVALGGGDRFEPGRMLLYPVSLAKLFAFDFLSDLTSLTSVFAIPSIVAVGVGVGLGSRSLLAGLVVSACAVASGLSLSKLVSVGVGAMMQSRRTRGEMVLALLGAALGLTSMMAGQLMPVLERYSAYLDWTRWTPPGAAAHALARGVFGGDASALVVSLLVLGAYATGCALLSYRIARRTALGEGRGASPSAASKNNTKAGAETRASAVARAATQTQNTDVYAGWQLPLASPQFSAVFEKELRYALRNAQLRVIALMAVGLTVLLRMRPAALGTHRTWEGISPYAEGGGAIFSVLYIFMLVSPLSTNLFGYDGAGMRTVVLSPVSRRTVLAAKNAAVTLIALVLVAAGVFVGGFILGDLTAPTLLFAALTFLTTAGLFAPFGNWLSMQFPKRVQFGKRMNRSGVGGLLLVPLFFLLAAPPAAAVLAAHFAKSYTVKYVILAAFALLSACFYALAVTRQGRQLERRELEILEAVTGRGGGEDGQIIG
jgi:ABC-2 type transport system permease protein